MTTRHRLALSSPAAALTLALGLTLLALVPAATTRATTLRYQSVEDLARAADVVVWGDAQRVGTRMQRTSGGLLRPERVVDLRVREALHGRAGDTLAVELLGGAHRLGERRVHGEAELREGEEVVLFLSASGARLRVLGMAMGVLRVEREPGHQPRLVRRVDDAAILDAAGRALPPLHERLSFDDLRRALRRARGGS